MPVGHDGGDERDGGEAAPADEDPASAVGPGGAGHDLDGDEDGGRPERGEQDGAGARRPARRGAGGGT